MRTDRRSIRGRLVAGAIVLCPVFSLPSVAAQEPLGEVVPCVGQAISEIETVPQPAPALFRGLASTLLLYQPTRQDVARAFVMMREGGECTEERRTESARLLRRQRYLASARVRAMADTGGAVRLLVETVDEVPLVIGGDLGGGLSALTFGTSNLGGRGLLTSFSWTQGDAYRDGWGMRMEQIPLFGRPARARGFAERDPLGHTLDLSVGHEFLTNLQRTAWHFGVRDLRSFMTLRRGDDPFPVAVVADRTMWDLGGVARIGGRAFGVFGGGLLTQERFARNDLPVVVSDTGLVAFDPALIDDRYPSFRNTRISGVLGMRALRFIPAVGIGSLVAEQDLASGVQLGLQLGRTVSWFDATDNDEFVGVDLYAGRGSSTAFLGLGGQLEARRDRDADQWDGIVGSARAAFFWKPAEARTWEVSLEGSGAWRERLPFQLTFADPHGGLRGFRGSRDGGARRAVARVERRQVVSYAMGERAVWGYGLFADGGKLWSGGVPFGTTTSVRGSVGLSVLAAVPPQSPRLLRLDIAVPVTTGSPDSWQVRLLSVNTTARFWREPADVHRSRTGTPTSNIFQWP